MNRHPAFNNLTPCLHLQVKADKLREVKDGHDGTWVAHPALVKVALDIFNEHMTTKNNLANKRTDVHITQQDLLQVSSRTGVCVPSNTGAGGARQ